ncbi:MAG: hypothetical protein U9Q66_03875 [Patescibacteria group bacterium]|nr:hypothetical protein [Patescibacteria group bacterium]
MSVWIEWLIYIFILWVFLLILIKIMRLTFEVINAKNMVYMKITLPKADSKLDKEKETKKDFKEKV